MFRCASCHVVSVPKVSPFVYVLEQRPTTYAYTDLDGNPQTSAGTEIVREIKVCAACAGEEPRSVPKDPDFSSLLAAIPGYQAHAKKCKGFHTVKDQDGEEIDRIECTVCIRTKEIMRSIPAGALAISMEDRLAAPLRCTFAAVVLEAAIDRAAQADAAAIRGVSGARAKRDFMAASSFLQAYQKRGGKL